MLFPNQPCTNLNLLDLSKSNQIFKNSETTKKCNKNPITNGKIDQKTRKKSPLYYMGIPPAAPAHNASLVNRASSLNTFAGHGPLAHTVFWWAGPGLRVVSRASSPYTLAGQTPPVVTILRRHCSEELFFTWALVG